MDWTWLNDGIDWWSPARLSASAAITAVIIGGLTARNGSRTLKQTREDSERRSRPMVSAELRIVPYVNGAQQLVIRNHGPSIARNVRVVFDPPIPEGKGQGSDMGRFIRARYAEPISTLVPDIELDNLWYALGPGSKPATNLPDKCTVTITVDNPSRPKEPYVDVFELDVDLLVHRSYITTSAAPEEKIKEIAKHLKGIDRTLKSWKAWWPTRRDVADRSEAQSSSEGWRGSLWSALRRVTNYR